MVGPRRDAPPTPIRLDSPVVASHGDNNRNHSAAHHQLTGPSGRRASRPEPLSPSALSDSCEQPRRDIPQAIAPAASPSPLHGASPVGPPPVANPPLRLSPNRLVADAGVDGGSIGRGGRRPRRPRGDDRVSPFLREGADGGVGGRAPYESDFEGFDSIVLGRDRAGGGRGGEGRRQTHQPPVRAPERPRAVSASSHESRGDREDDERGDGVKLDDASRWPRRRHHQHHAAAAATGRQSPHRVVDIVGGASGSYARPLDAPATAAATRRARRKQLRAWRREQDAAASPRGLAAKPTVAFFNGTNEIYRRSYAGIYGARRRRCMELCPKNFTHAFAEDDGVEFGRLLPAWQ